MVVGVEKIQGALFRLEHVYSQRFDCLSPELYHSIIIADDLSPHEL